MAINQNELVKAVGSSMYRQVKEKGYATAVDTLMDMHILSNRN